MQSNTCCAASGALAVQGAASFAKAGLLVARSERAWPGAPDRVALRRAPPKNVLTADLDMAMSVYTCCNLKHDAQRQADTKRSAGACPGMASLQTACRNFDAVKVLCAYVLVLCANTV